jgi:hypothetical protein
VPRSSALDLPMRTLGAMSLGFVFARLNKNAYVYFSRVLPVGERDGGWIPRCAFYSFHTASLTTSATRFTYERSLLLWRV